MLLKILLLGEKCRDANMASGCFVKELGARECRKGCEDCSLNELLEKAMKGFCKDEGPGKINNSHSRPERTCFRLSKLPVAKTG